jgi:transcriptional regulator with XRE-family HTH domain
MARSTSKEVAAYCQWRIREWVRSGKSARELAKAAGVSSTQISELQSQGIGAGWKTVEGLAKAFGMTMPELMTVANEWAASQPTPPPSPSLATSRRAHAADLAKEDGISDEAIRSVLAEPIREEDAQRSTLWWALRMRRRDIALVEGPPRRA